MKKEQIEYAESFALSVLNLDVMYNLHFSSFSSSKDYWTSHQTTIPQGYIEVWIEDFISFDDEPMSFWITVQFEVIPPKNLSFSRERKKRRK